MTDTAPPARAWSLRQRLLILLGALIVALLGAVSTAFYLDARKASQELFDNSMKEAARLILQLAEHEVAEHGRLLGLQLLHAETKPGAFALRFQVWTDDMRQARQQDASRAEPLLPLDAEGFGWVDVDGETWRAFAIWNLTHTVQVQLVQSPRHRQDLTQETAGHLAVTALLVLALAAAALFWILGRTVQPVARIAHAVSRRTPEDLSPLDACGVPQEVQPLISAFNGLLGRIREKRVTETRFTADASHELRTPLAAIKANAQVLVGARDAAERDIAADGLLASVDRSAHIVDQLLALARADARGLADLSQRPEVVLDDLARAQVWEHSGAAAKRAITLTLESESVAVRGDASLLTILLRNLVDNAIRYTPVGGSVRVRVCVEDARPLVVVTDTGPGIPPALREQVFERFFRLPGNPASGSGLGLSIVARIALLHGAEVSVTTAEDGRGARFEVRFPAT